MHLPAWFNITGDLVSIAVITDYLRLRRRLRIDAQAKRAEELLIGVTSVDGIELPDPMDPRWVTKYEDFGDPRDPKKQSVLAIGEVLVTIDTCRVYVGVGPYLAAGFAYGRTVVAAYRRRVAAKVKQ